MALYAYQGIMGSGKSYVLVNCEIRDFLVNSKRKVYSTLPINREAFLHDLSWSNAKRAAYSDRLIQLEPGSEVREVAEYDEDGEPTGELVKRRVNRIKEFWWFVDPGSVVFVDEAADVWNKNKVRGKRSARPESLQSFINHHRHYKLDVFIACQSRHDLDPEIESKVLYVYDVTNMKYEPMFPGVPALRGLKWPIQFFRVWVFIGKNIMGKKGDLTKFEPLRNFAVRPTPRGYLNYRSFSAAHTLKGMKELPADDNTQTTDTEGGRARFVAWLKGSGQVFAVIIGFCGGLLLALNLFLWAATGFKGPWYGGLGALAWWRDTPKEAKQAAVVAPVAEQQRLSVAGETKSNSVPALQVRVKMITPNEIRLSDGRSFRVGSQTAYGRIDGIFLNGFRAGGHEYRHAVLLSGQRDTGVGSGERDK